MISPKTNPKMKMITMMTMTIFSQIKKLFIEDIADIKQSARYKRRVPQFIRHLTKEQILTEISRAKYERAVLDDALLNFKNRKRVVVDYVG